MISVKEAVKLARPMRLFMLDFSSWRRHSQNSIKLYFVVPQHPPPSLNTNH
jgi:hypothetical protein